MIARALRTLALGAALSLVLSSTSAWSGTLTTLEGRVIDPDGRPVAGARVVVTHAIGTAAETVTDEAGRFVLAGLRAGAYDIVVVREGFRAEPRRVEVGDAPPPAIEVRLALSAFSDAIVVSAAQTDVPLSAAQSHITIVDGADLQATQAESLIDALRFAPGYTVAATGGRGALTTAFPRGGESDYTMVLIDGVRTNLFGGLFDFAQMPVSDVDHIEIVRGAQSALFGSDAIGGVVHVISRTGGPFRFDLSGQGGSYGTSLLAGAMGGRIGRFSIAGNGERTASDGDTGTAPATGEPVTNDDYARRSAGVRVRYGSAWGSLAATARFATDGRGVPGPYGSDPNGTYSGVDRISRSETDRRELSLAAERLLGSTWQLRGQVGDSEVRSQYSSPFGDSTSSSHRLAGRAVVDLVPHVAVGVTAGVEQMRERAESTFILGDNAEEIPIARSMTGVFGEVRLAPHARWLVTAGVRVERIARDALEPDPFAFPPRPAFASDRVVSTNPKLSASVLLRGGDGTIETTRLKANAGTGIRAPDAFEIAFTDNPSLDAERSRSVDVGIEQTLWQGRATVEGVVFDNRYDDLIVTVGRSFRDASQFSTDNLSNARARGVELSLQARPLRALSLRAAYTWLDTEILAVDGTDDVAPSPFVVGDPLIRRPRHQGTLYLLWSAAGGSAYARLVARGGSLDIDPSFGAFGGQLPAPGFTSTDVGGSVRLVGGFDAFVRVMNLFDRAYEEVLGYPALGRQVIAGARLAVGR